MAIENERKFLLIAPPNLTDPVFAKFSCSEIEQVYLISIDDGSRRIRRRSEKGDSVYYFTSKRSIDAANPGRRQEDESQIESWEYEQYGRDRDPSLRVINKRRRCFVYNNQYFELDEFYELGFWMLEIELTENEQVVELPPCLASAVEVTNDSRYYNRAIAAR